MAQPQILSDDSNLQLPTEAAYSAVLPEIAELSDDRAVAINVDVVSAVTSVLGMLPELRSLRAQIQEELPKFDLQRFDKLQQYALALSHANTVHRGTFTPKGSIADQGNELTVIRDRLLTTAQALVSFGLMDSSQIKECKKATGYRPTAADVLMLVEAFKEKWSNVEGKAPVTLPTLHDAGNRALELLNAVGLKEQGPVSSTEAAMLRQKAFGLFLRAYEDARRAVTYLRHTRATPTRSSRPSMPTAATGARVRTSRRHQLRRAHPVRHRLRPTPSRSTTAPASPSRARSRTDPRARPVTRTKTLFLGAAVPPTGGKVAPHHLPPHHLTTHGVVVGMTGSGKTGLIMVTVEEALRARIPVIMIDVKGDLPNLLLTFPNFAPAEFVPWLEGQGSPDEAPAESLAEQLAAERQRELGRWGIHAPDVELFRAGTELRVLTPGSTAGEPVHILSSLERRSTSWETDPEASRAAVSAAISLVLRLIGKDPDPAKSREHVLLSVLAERRMQQGQTAELGALMNDVVDPPVDRIGALEVEDFLSNRDRKNLAAALNTLLASPTFASWRQGVSLDIREWLTPKNGRTPAVVVSVAHLEDEERALVLGVLLEEILAYTRGLPGTRRLRALIVFDECYGLLPPHPANPPTKRPTIALMKQARAFGVGVIISSQNPMDLDYRALSNAGFWAVGRLQTDADRERVVDGLANDNEKGSSAAELTALIRRLGPRWFFVRDVHAKPNTMLLQPRWALSYLRGPMTLGDIRRATGRATLPRLS